MRSAYRLLPALVLIVTLVGCSKPSTGINTEARDGAISVSASFYPLAYLTQRIAGDYATVHQIIPHGVEPHDYEPNPAQIVTVYGSKLLVMNGLGLDPWADALRGDLQSANVTVLSAAETVPDILLAQEEDHQESNHASGEEGQHEEHGHSLYDPHVWLDPVSMMTLAEHIVVELKKADPLHAEAYENNGATLMEDLKKLDEEFRLRLAACTHSMAIVSHDAFRYLGRRYGFETVALAGIAPEQEPSPEKIVEVIKTIKKHGVPVVFFETLVSPKLAETVARSAGATTLILNPAEGLKDEQIAQGETYLSIMKQNAMNLAIGLGCKDVPTASSSFDTL